MKISKQSYEKQLELYMKYTRSELANILVNRNRTLDDIQEIDRFVATKMKFGL